MERKSGKEFCPVCLRSMPYKEVDFSMKKWAPSAYAWRCDPCAVWVLDGKLDGNGQAKRVESEVDEKPRLSGMHAALRFLASATKRERPE